MVESVVYGARHSAGGADRLRSAGNDPGDAGGPDAGGTGGGGSGILPGAGRRAGYAELAGGPSSALWFVCAGFGVLVGGPACGVGPWSAPGLSPLVRGGDWFV